MKIIKNNLIPFKGFNSINLFGVLFVRGEGETSARTLRHEGIHTKQMKELLYIPFYLLYVMEWIVRLFMKGNAYRNISFEREAYRNQHWDGYLLKRKRYAWINYLKKKRQ